MVFARHLRAVGDRFRSRYLNSTDEADRTPFQEDWTKMQVAAGMAAVSGCTSSRSLYRGPGSVGMIVPLGVTSLVIRIALTTAGALPVELPALLWK